MIALVEGAARQRTPNEIALSLVLSTFTLIFLVVTRDAVAMARYAEQYMAGYSGQRDSRASAPDIPTLVGLLVCLIPTTIGALLAAIGIAGMDRGAAGEPHRQEARRSRSPGTSTRSCRQDRDDTLGNARPPGSSARHARATEVGHLAPWPAPPTRRPRQEHRRAAPATPGAVWPPRRTARSRPFTAQTR